MLESILCAWQSNIHGLLTIQLGSFKMDQNGSNRYVAHPFRNGNMISREAHIFGMWTARHRRQNTGAAWRHVGWQAADVDVLPATRQRNGRAWDTCMYENMRMCGCHMPPCVHQCDVSVSRAQLRDFIWQGIPQVPPGLATNSHKTLIDSSTSCLGSLTCFFCLSLLLLWSSFTPMSPTLHFYVIDLVWLGVWWELSSL